MSPHDRYRARLAALAAADWHTLIPACEARAGEGPGGSWRRIYGRFQPGHSPWALLVLEQTEPQQRLLRAELFEDPGATASASAAPGRPAPVGPLRVAELGWLRLSPLVPDPCLPALGAALAGPDEATVVRYRPFRRCTLRVVVDGTTSFVKVFPDERARELHAQAARLQAAASRGELGFAVAAAGRLAASGQVLVQPRLPGLPVVADLKRPGAAALARRLGRALGSLHACRIAPARALERRDLDRRLERDLAALRDRVPALAGPVAELAAAIRASVGRASAAPLVPVHGSPHASQWLADGERLALVDFDRICLAPREFDVATFQAEQLFERNGVAPASVINTAFAAGVEETGRSLDPALLGAYLAQKALAKALRSAGALRPDGDDAARRHLQTARDAIEAAA